MNGATHMAGGVAAAGAYLIATQQILPPHLALAALGAGLVGGLLPDIDHPGSTISHTLKPVNALVSFIFTHRGFFHTPILYLVLWSLWIWLCPQPEYLIWGNLVFCGIVSHLVLDLLNPGGIPVFFPFDRERHRLAHIRTGGKAEGVIRSLLYVVVGGIIVLVTCAGMMPH